MPMRFNELKSDLHQLIDGINDDSKLKAIYVLLSKKLDAEETDWWENLSIGDRTLINKGLKDQAEGKVIPHAEVKKDVRHFLKDHE